MTEQLNKDQILQKLNDLQEKAYTAGNVSAVKSILPAVLKTAIELNEIIQNMQNFLAENGEDSDIPTPEQLEEETDQIAETVNI